MVGGGAGRLGAKRHRVIRTGRATDGGALRGGYNHADSGGHTHSMLHCAVEMSDRVGEDRTTRPIISS